MNFLDSLKIALAGIALIAVIAITWEVQEWRWEAKQRNALQEQATQLFAESKKQALAAANFEKQREQNDVLFSQLNKALDDAKSTPTDCLDANRLLFVNSALSRTAPHSTGLAHLMPKANSVK